jgi:hypothetical protein
MGDTADARKRARPLGRGKLGLLDEAKISRQRGVPLATVVREAVDRYLGRTEEGTTLALGSDPADGIIGAVTGSTGDESVNHDHYLYGWPKETDGDGGRVRAAKSAGPLRADRADRERGRDSGPRARWRGPGRRPGA